MYVENMSKNDDAFSKSSEVSFAHKMDSDIFLKHSTSNWLQTRVCGATNREKNV